MSRLAQYIAPRLGGLVPICRLVGSDSAWEANFRYKRFAGLILNRRLMCARRVIRPVSQLRSERPRYLVNTSRVPGT